METTATREEVVTSSTTKLDEVDWDFELQKLQCSLDHPESCEMCQG